MDGDYDGHEDMLFERLSQSSIKGTPLSPDLFANSEMVGTFFDEEADLLMYDEDEMIEPADVDNDLDTQETTQLYSDLIGTTPSDAPRYDAELAAPTKKNRQAVIADIERIFEDTADALLENRTRLSITLLSRSSSDPGVNSSISGQDATKRQMCFPGANASEAWRYTVLIRILELVHGALTTDTIISKRDIYYRHPTLFVKQAVVDRHIDDLAFTFGVSRQMLNVSAAAKGLIAGNVTFSLTDGTTVDIATEKHGMLVPHSTDIATVDLQEVKRVIVIEKEASFRSIVSSAQWKDLTKEVLLVTAKGYPDLSTRSFLHLVATANAGRAAPPSIDILVDFDPDGLAIMSTYAFGSKSLAHETAALALPAARLCYLGLKSSHFLHPTLRCCATGSAEASVAEERTLRMSARDRRKARSMLANSALTREDYEDGMDHIRAESRRELQVMLVLNVKAEMQVLEEEVEGIAGWLVQTLAA